MSTFLPAYSAFACSQPFQDFSSAALHIVSSMHRTCTFWNLLSQPRQPCLPRTRCRMLMARPGLGRSSPPAAPAPLPPGGFVRVPLARFVPWGAVTALRLWGCGASTATGTGAGMSSSPSSPRVVAGGTERAANIRLL